MVEISVALLDIDGTLLDSNDAHARAWVDALKEFEIHRDFVDVRKLIGMGADQLLPRLLSGPPDDDLIQQISDRRGVIFRERYLADLKPFPGARGLVEKIRRSFITPVAATSASKEDVEALLEKADVQDLIEIRTTSDDVERSKPSGEIIRAALDKVGSVSAYAVMIGDTPYDIRAASKARVKTIAFTCGGWSNTALSDAVAIYEGPADLLNRFDASALGRRFKSSSP